MVRRQGFVDELVGFSEVDRGEPPVVLGEFLLDDVGFNRDAEVVGLAGDVRGCVVVDPILFKIAVAQVTP